MVAHRKQRPKQKPKTKLKKKKRKMLHPPVWPNADTFIFFICYCLIGLVSFKDKVLLKVVICFSLVHFFNLFYYPVTWVDLCLEAVICTALAATAYKASKRDWSLSLMFLMLTANLLILVEFLDYFCCNSYFINVYSQWVTLQTIMELIILAMASNGLLQRYTVDGRLGNNSNKHYINL